MINKEIQDYVNYLLFLKYDRQAVFGSLITKHLKDNKGKLYRKPIPIYKFGDNLKESDSLERQHCILILLFFIFYDLSFQRLIV